MSWVAMLAAVLCLVRAVDRERKRQQQREAELERRRSAAR